jgi:hypothetical protein
VFHLHSTLRQYEPTAAATAAGEIDNNNNQIHRRISKNLTIVTFSRCLAKTK